MKAIIYALLVITLVATSSADSGTPLWAGVWKCDYDGTSVFLVIDNDLTGYVFPDTQGEVASIATLENGKVSADGTTYTARWIEVSSSQPGEGDIADFKLTRSKPTEFTGTVTWPDGFWLPFNGKWHGGVAP
jgi:hypothetical protein